MKGVKSPALWTVTEDHIMAHRYMYYCTEGFTVITDQQYDLLEKSFKESDEYDSKSPVATVGSSDKDSYPAHVKYLAMYLGKKHLMKIKPKKKK